MTATIDYGKIQELSLKAYSKEATKADKDALVTYLYQIGKIDDRMYDDYKDEPNAKYIVDGALSISAIILFTRMIHEALKPNKSLSIGG